MKKHEIKVGGLYRAKVGANVTTVRVDAIREVTKFAGTNRYSGQSDYRDAVVYDVTNMVTKRTTTFRSAAKFRSVAVPIQPTNVEEICDRVLAGENGIAVETVTIDEDGAEVADSEAGRTRGQ